MPYYICDKSELQCSMGDATSRLHIRKKGLLRIILQDNDIATYKDNRPMENILPFGQCQSILNPKVAVATAANYGRLQPMPCMPKTLKFWLGFKEGLLARGMPVLTDQSLLMCAWGGKITVCKTPNTTITGE